MLNFSLLEGEDTNKADDAETDASERVKSRTVQIIPGHFIITTVSFIRVATAYAQRFFADSPNDTCSFKNIHSNFEQHGVSSFRKALL